VISRKSNKSESPGLLVDCDRKPEIQAKMELLEIAAPTGVAFEQRAVGLSVGSAREGL
jgi:hypothetical protein